MFDDQFDRVLQPFVQSQHVITASLNAGGQPPLIGHVVSAYRSIESDLEWAWQLAEVAVQVHDKGENELEPVIDARWKWLRSQTLARSPLRDWHERGGFDGVSWSPSMVPQPTARVLGAQHNNPLETVVALSAAAAISAIVGSTWAARSWLKARGERGLQESAAGLLDAVTDAIKSADPRMVTAATPIAIRVLRDAVAPQYSPDSLEIRATPAFQFTVKRGNGGKTTGHKRSNSPLQPTVARRKRRRR
jgi:hypothetical protein